MAETKDVQEQEQEEQNSSWLGDVVRVTILLWSMGILTANYLGYFLSGGRPYVSCVAFDWNSRDLHASTGQIKQEKERREGR